MITAEEFIEEKYSDVPYELKDITDLMVEFAKLHVTEALKEASEKANYGIYKNNDGQEPYHHESNIYVDEDSILNAYPLDNIK